MSSLKAVIMAGGRGTRFWPLSRQNRPKQFLNVTGRRTLLQETLARLEPLLAREEVFIACGASHERNVYEQLPGLSARQLILEPVGRNTAPCIGMAAARIQEAFGDSVMAVLPADHNVEKVDEFRAVLQAAEELAREDWLVTFGIRPTFAATGYGYVGQGAPLTGGERAAYRVSEFVEKPDAEKAEQLIQAGSYSWNSGMFVWKTSTILKQIDKHLPALAEFLGKMAGQWDDKEKLDREFRKLPSVSIDYGVMERAGWVAVIPCDLGWSDLGNWQALGALLPRDRSGNASHGVVRSHDSHDCVVHAGQKTVVLLGVENLVVVDTTDALLICDVNRAEEVKAVVEQLEREGQTDLI